MDKMEKCAYMRMSMSYPLQYNIINKYFNREQSGGAIKQVKYENYLFNVDISSDKFGIKINVIIPDEHNPMECVIISVDIDQKLAVIQGITKIEQCTIPAFVDSRGFGSLLLRFSLSFLRQYKEKFKINRIALQDNSLKPCKHCNDDVRMADVHFLINGDTWYGKHGFRPFDPPTNKPDKAELEIYNNNKKIIDKAITSDVSLYDMIENAVNELKIIDINLNNIKKFIKHNRNHKLSKVLGLFYDRYNLYCCVFTVIARKIMQTLNMTSFYKKDFYLDI